MSSPLSCSRSLDVLVAGLGEGHLALLLVELDQTLGLDQLLELFLAVGLLELFLDPVGLDHHALHQLVDGHIEIGAILDRARR